MYPVQILLGDGQMAAIRPMTLADSAAIDAMHDRVSKQSLYSRYFVPNKPSLGALRDQFHLSRCRGAALVASLQNEIIGVAYYLLPHDDFQVAEPALLVEDRFQCQGLGGALFDLLIQEARSQAVQRFRAFILPENQRMLHILDRNSLPKKRRYCDGMFEVELFLDPQNINS